MMQVVEKVGHEEEKLPKVRRPNVEYRFIQAEGVIRHVEQNESAKMKIT